MGENLTKVSFYIIASEASNVSFFAYPSIIFDLFCAVNSMLNIKVDLFTSYISKVCKFTQHCLLCIKKVENIRQKKIFLPYFLMILHIVERQMVILVAFSISIQSIPILLGTNCGSKRVCFEGRCVNETSWNPQEVNSTPQWSPWESLGACKSACIARSRGFRKLSRSCTLTQTLVKSSQEAEERLSPQTVVETRLKPF